MKQKFAMHRFVHVLKVLPETMSHFDNDFDGIVAGTYSQLYGGNDIYSYSLYKIKEGKIVDKISWYNEEQLLKVKKSKYPLSAARMIETYNMRNG
jgi:hypothetical protein